MVATTFRTAAEHDMTTVRVWPRVGLRFVAILLALLTTALTIDALIEPIAPFDVPVTNAVQRLDVPGLATLMHAVEQLTSSEGAIAAWLFAMLIFAVARAWLPALALMSLPVGGILNEGLGSFIVQRTRPDSAIYDIQRALPDIDAPSFPSGHVMGAVLLYGLFFFLAGKLDNRLLRAGVRTFSASVIAIAGFQRVWDGAHWPTDVLAAYSLGGLLLVGLIAAYQWIDAAAGHLPFVHAGYVPHDEQREHAHALTSTVFFQEETVSKVYAPGFVPRALYWLAYQAEFPYIRNRQALEAARERRNLAALLTEYWYGQTAVARVTAVDAIDGNLALTSERVNGGEPADRQAAKVWLQDLRARFEEAGLPTWQIDPRQPRAIDNVLETADGRYMIVDLESGLVSPLASLKTWWRAIRRGMVPIYDDVYFDVTRAYVAAERSQMQATLGAEWLTELDLNLAQAEAATTDWHASEPRIWSRTLTAAWHGFYVRSWPQRVQARVDGGQQKATEWLTGAVAAWQADGRIDAGQSERLRAEIASPAVQAVLPHFGAHFVITVVLRFPFGSIARFAWSLWGLSSATAKLVLRKLDRESWKHAWEVHHPVVIVLSLIPGFGAFAYLAARPVRSNRLLLRVAVDAVMLKLPKELWQRSGLRRLVAPPSQLRPAPVPVRVPAGPRIARRAHSRHALALAARASRRSEDLGDLSGPVAQTSHRQHNYPEGIPPLL